VSIEHLTGSTERLTLTDCRSRLDCAQALGLVQAVAKRPFAADGLIRVERCRRQFEAIGHFHRHRDDVYGVIVHEPLMMIKCERPAERLRELR
jgi:hypothetical protein